MLHQIAASVLLKMRAVCLLKANAVVSNDTNFSQTRQNVTVGVLMLQINPVTYRLLEIKEERKSPNSDMASRKPFEATDSLSAVCRQSGTRLCFWVLIMCKGVYLHYLLAVWYIII